MQGWDAVDPDLRDRIERGVPAIMRINRHETFNDWLAVGEALAAMQTAAMRLAGSNTATGKGYNAAYKVISAQVPDLTDINKTTRSHAIWLASNRESIVPWHERLASNIRQTVNHPTTIKRRYDREAGPVTEDGAAAGRPPGLRDEVQRLQIELDDANRKIRRLERDQESGSDFDWQDAPQDIARVLMRKYPNKSKQVASAILELSKSTAPRPRRRTTTESGDQ